MKYENRLNMGKYHLATVGGVTGHNSGPARAACGVGPMSPRAVLPLGTKHVLKSNRWTLRDVLLTPAGLDSRISPKACKHDGSALFAIPVQLVPLAELLA